MGGLIFGLAALAAAVYFSKGETVTPTKAPSPSRSDFASSFLAAAKAVDLKGIPVNMALAQAALETGWGTGGVFQTTQNLFSITATSAWKGGTWKNPVNGLVFRVYPSWSSSIKDWVALIGGTSYYAKAYALAVAGNYKAFYQELQDRNYGGSDAQYAAKLTTTYQAVA